MGCHATKIKHLEEVNADDSVIQTVFRRENCNKSYGLQRTNGTSPNNIGQMQTPHNVKARNIRRGKGNHNQQALQRIAGRDRLHAKYEFKAVIWKGTFSTVNRVEDRVTKQPYAMKIIDTSKGQSVFQSELGVLRRVNHPNVIHLIEVMETGENICMVMELATGGSLLDRLETYGPFSEIDAIKVLKMLLSALSYLHNLGITHRDLKPDNLLYYHPGLDSKIMVIDFGFSSTPKSNGSPYMHTVCGTPQYIAPEIISGRSYTSAVDMWATGIITYIVLSCIFPFDANKESVMYKQILKGSYSMDGVVWDNISSSAKKFINDLLQHHPENRTTAAEAANHEWIQNGGNTKLEKVQKSRISGRYSNKSSHSAHSSISRRSTRSLRLHQNRVEIGHLESLKSVPEVAHIMVGQENN